MRLIYFFAFVFCSNYCLAQCGPGGCGVPTQRGYSYPQMYSRPQQYSYPQRNVNYQAPNNTPQNDLYNNIQNRRNIDPSIPPIGRNGKPMKEDGDPNAKSVPMGPDGYPNSGPLRFLKTNPEPPHVVPEIFGTPSFGQLDCSPLVGSDVSDWLIDPVTEKVKRAPWAKTRWKPNPADDVAELTPENPGVRADLYCASKRHLFTFLGDDFDGKEPPEEIKQILERDKSKPIQWTKAAALPPNQTKGKILFLNGNIANPNNVEVAGESNVKSDDKKYIESLEKRLDKLEGQMKELFSSTK